MTTRYRADELDGAFFGILHETATPCTSRAAQGGARGCRGQRCRSASTRARAHVGESRGRSRAFWQHFGPVAGSTSHDCQPQRRRASVAVNDVRPSFIRTEATR
jgi:Zn-dependent M32 family carboxypeptidase